MAVTPSSMMPLGTKAPDFRLFDTVSGKTISLKEARSDIATVIMFICNHCPFVKHIQKAVAEVAKKYQQKGISFIAICSNDAREYPSDNPQNMKMEAVNNGYTFPYLHDDTQQVAKAYDATCTPDFFVFDKNLACVYRGRFDDATPGNSHPVTGKELCAALDAILAGRNINPDQQPSVGCNIKWRKG